MMTYYKLLNVLKSYSLEISDIKEIFLLLKKDFNQIALYGNDIINNNIIEPILSKLKKGYPIPYISKHIKVNNLDLYINKNVLIPRTETIDFILGYIKDNYDFNNKTILDLCTGSGIISILLKDLYPTSIISASDISFSALNVAKKNFKLNKLDINLINSDYFNNINSSFDIIISNPPYIPHNRKELITKYEPKLALFEKEDGLRGYRLIFNQLDKHLNDKGIAFFELESINYQNIIDLFKKNNSNYLTKLYYDLENKPRYLIVNKN